MEAWTLFNLRHSRVCGGVLILTLIFCFLPAYAVAHVKKKVRTTKRTQSHRLSMARRLRRPTSRGRYRALRGRLRFSHGRRTRYHSVRAHARRPTGSEISPQRAQQIQEALVEAGDLHETPTGRWDTQTRQAMKQYQQSNGFQRTGLPDAKSLMKMGLGPHPLPSDLDPMARPRAGLRAPSTNSPTRTTAAAIRP